MLGLLNFMEQRKVGTFRLILLAVLFYRALAGKNNCAVWTSESGIIFPDKEKLLALRHGILYYKVNM